MDLHLDEPLAELDFAVLEATLAELTYDEILGNLGFYVHMQYEGRMSDDQCSACRHQEANGSRAAELALAELHRRG